MLMLAAVAAACGGPRTYAGDAARPTSKLVDSDCGAAASCDQRCRQGDLPACTRQADLLAASDWSGAVELWSRTCERGDAGACVRAMAAAPGDQADHAAARACAAGVGGACAMVGRSQMLRAQAGRSRTDQKILHDDAATLLRRACALDDWVSCVAAWVAGVIARGAAAKQQGATLRDRGRALAEVACGRDDSAACSYLADVHAQRDPAAAGRYNARACALDLRGITDPRALAIVQRGEDCRRAASLGVALPAIDAPAPTSTPFRMISGNRQIQPSDATKVAIHRRGLRTMSAKFRVCISPVGLVDDLAVLDASRAPEWDRELFDSMRRWRFQAMAGGTPTRHCSTYTFKYNQ